MRYAWMFVAVLAIAGCKKDPPIEDPGDLGLGDGSGSGTGTGSGTAVEEGGAPKALVDAQDAQLAVLEQLSAAAVAATPDCAKMTTDMNAVLASGEDALHAMDQYTEAEIMEHQAELEDKFGARIDTAMAAFGEALEPCEEDAGIQDILKALGLM